MIIKDYKCKCGCDDFFFSDNGNQTGIYCSRCGMWLKWADKNEQNLRMKQESCEDAISRAEALKVVDDMDIPEDMSVFEIKSHISVEISTLPPVTSTQKKGKWEQYGDFWKEKYRCSECKEEQPKILCGEQIIRLWSNYCPHCGAKMQEVEE